MGRKFFILVIILFFSETIFSVEENFESVLFKLKQQFDNINNYLCTIESYTSKKDKSEFLVLKYFFSKPKSVRIEIISGKNKGTILLLNQNKVRVKPGNRIFSVLTLTFNPDDKKVCDIRGRGVHESDWGWFIDKHIGNLEYFDSKYLYDETVEGISTMVYELHSKDINKTEEVNRETIWIDKERYIIIKYIQYDKDEKIIQASSYKNIALNQELDEKIFTSFK